MSFNERAYQLKSRERDSMSPLPHTTDHTSRSRSRSPDIATKLRDRSRKHSDSSSHSRKYSRRSRTRSRSPNPARMHERRRSRSRSKSPQRDPKDQLYSSRRSRSRSRSESPPRGRRSRKSRSPPSYKRHPYTTRRSRSRSKSPSHNRRKVSRRSHSRSKSPSHSRRDHYRRSRSRSRSPTYGKGYRPHDYKHRSQYSSNWRGRGFQDKRYHKDGPKYHSASTPIANVPATPTVPLSASQPNMPPSSVPTASTALSEKLTPEQKLERALVAAQALNPKMSAPQSSISALSMTAASAATNPLLKNPPVTHKKKLMWGSKKSSSGSAWEGVTLGEETDEGAQAKFRRLMGMGKASFSQPSSQSPAASSEGNTLKEQHEKLRKDLEQQYESSRYMTHLARGSGLGFGFSSYDSTS